MFTLKRYQASVMENLRLDPPAPIVQVHAEDMDEGRNGGVRYSILSGNEGGECTIILYFIALMLEATTLRNG
jgi:hypothetical protein